MVKQMHYWLILLCASVILCGSHRHFLFIELLSLLDKENLCECLMNINYSPKAHYKGSINHITMYNYVLRNCNLEHLYCVNKLIAII